MSIIKTEGIVIRVLNYLESSKIITCFTPDYGKISLIAKGAKRVKSRTGGTIDLLHHIAIVYYQKHTREIQTLSQSELIDSFQYFQSDLQKLSYGLAVLEFINKLEITKQPNPMLFRWTLEALKSLEKATIPEVILYQFIWKWIENSGFHPRLNRCLQCGAVCKTGRVFFSIKDGGFFCSDCSITPDNNMEISVKCIKLLYYLRENSALTTAKMNVAEYLLSELRDISWRFFSYHSNENWSLKSLEFLKRLKNSNLGNEMKRRKLSEKK